MAAARKWITWVGGLALFVVGANFAVDRMLLLGEYRYTATRSVTQTYNRFWCEHHRFPVDRADLMAGIDRFRRDLIGMLERDGMVTFRHEALGRGAIQLVFRASDSGEVAETRTIIGDKIQCGGLEPYPRFANVGIRKRASRIAQLHPVVVRVQFYSSDSPQPGFTSEPELVMIASPAEIRRALAAFEASDREEGREEPAAQGKDGLMRVTFVDNKGDPIGQFSVLASEMDLGWGREVSLLFDRYLPSTLELSKDLKVMPRRR